LGKYFAWSNEEELLDGYYLT
jgi:hypothetical protein